MSACECPVPARAVEEQQSLLAAFSSFTEAAGALEQSYHQLQAEVAGLREQLRAANAELQEQREAQQRFRALAEVSTLLAHEIRNPLGSLELFASLLAEIDFAPEPRRWIRQIQAGLRTLSATVNNVLNLHSNTAEFVGTDMAELLHWTTEFLRPLAEQSGIQLQLLNELHGVTVRADPHRLRQVLLNIALNAFHFSPSGGRVAVSGRSVATEGGRLVKIELSDAGPGIAPEYLEKIFEPGFSTRRGSAGLGLAVCKEIMAQHRGTIRVSSQLGRGATFVLTLPAENLA